MAIFLTSRVRGASASCSAPAPENAFPVHHLLHTGKLGCHTSCLLCQLERQDLLPEMNGLGLTNAQVALCSLQRSQCKLQLQQHEMHVPREP